MLNNSKWQHCRSDVTPFAAAFQRKDMGAITLIELMVAVAVLGTGFIATMSAVSYMQFENLASSQRMLAASIEMESLELFKVLPLTQITNSTAGAPIYLKQLSGGGCHPSWQVPVSGAWKSVPVESVSSTSGGDPVLLADKLPNALWTASFTTDATDSTLRQISVMMQWNLYNTTKR